MNKTHGEDFGAGAGAGRAGGGARRVGQVK